MWTGILCYNGPVISRGEVNGRPRKSKTGPSSVIYWSGLFMTQLDFLNEGCPVQMQQSLSQLHFLYIFPFFVRVLTWSFSKYSSITQSHHWVCDVDGLKPQQLPTGIVLVATAICPFIAALTSQALDQPPLCWLMYYYAECDADLFNQLPLFP